MTDIDALFDGKLAEADAKALVLELSDTPVTVERLIMLAKAMRSRMHTIQLGVPVLDTCGTGGDGAKTFNISTAVALLCAQRGIAVAKHGNVAATSISGSADVLNALGIPTQLMGDDALAYFRIHRFLFLFAKLYHPAMKFVAPIRQAIGRKTIFNILGPLCNPAQAQYQLVGVSDPTLAPMMGEALMQLGVEHAVVVASHDRLDEVSVAAPTQVFDFTRDQQQQFVITPQHAHDISALQVQSVGESATIIKHLLAGEASPAVREVIRLNLGLALYAANRASSFEHGYAQTVR